MIQEKFYVSTHGRSIVEITDQINDVIRRSGKNSALCNVFIHHTSASLFINENADPNVRGDLERFFSRLVTDGDPIFLHIEEGEDDMSAHVRSVLTATSINIPVDSGACDLGTWQGIYLWEHRNCPHRRKITVSILG